MHVRGVGHPCLPGEVRDLARRNTLQPHLGRPQRIQRRQVRQAPFELGDRRRLRRGLQPVELAAPGRRVDQQQPFQPCPLCSTRSGRDRAEHAAVHLGADRGGQRVQRGVAGQLAALPHQLVQRHIDQVRRVILGLRRCANRGLGYLAYSCGLVLHVQPVPDELPMSLPGAHRVRLGRCVPGQPQLAAHMVDHHARHVGQLREISQPLIALQQHYQRQKMRHGRGLRPSPLDLVRGGRERLRQLPRRHHPLEPRIRGPINRRQPDTPTIKTVAGAS